MSSNIDLFELQHFAVGIAKEAGHMILAASTSRMTTLEEAITNEKKNSTDLVTETDGAVEEMVKRAISTSYPDHQFIGEETYSAGQKSILDDLPTWIVDPIDGTTNFVHAVPYVAISIGFTLGKIPSLGVILNPFTAQLYTAIRGEGSFLTQLTSDLHTEVSQSRLPLNPPPPLSLSSSVIAVEWGSDRELSANSSLDVKSRTFLNLTKQGGGMVHALRSYGSAALNLCGVASGFLDAYWEGGCWEWDVCAGWVVLLEAGGVMVDGNPKEGSLSEPDLCGRIYLAVRNASEEEQEDFIRKFWGLCAGTLNYER